MRPSVDGGDLEADLERRGAPDAPGARRPRRGARGAASPRFTAPTPPPKRSPRPLLHLDEDEPRAAAGDQVELVAAGADVGPEDPVAAQPVVARRDPLAAVHAATVT